MFLLSNLTLGKMKTDLFKRIPTFRPKKFLWISLCFLTVFFFIIHHILYRYIWKKVIIVIYLLRSRFIQNLITSKIPIRKHENWKKKIIPFRIFVLFRYFGNNRWRGLNARCKHIRVSVISAALRLYFCIVSKSWFTIPSTF